MLIAFRFDMSLGKVRNVSNKSGNITFSIKS